MGVGNWYKDDTEHVIIAPVDYGDDIPDMDTDTLQMDADCQYEDILWEIKNALPKSFTWFDKPEYVHDYPSDDRWIVAENGLLRIFVLGWECDTIVGIEARDFSEDEIVMDGFAFQHMHHLKNRLFNALDNCFELYVPTSIWTSRPYNREISV